VFFYWVQTGPVSMDACSIERAVKSRELEICVPLQQYWAFRSHEADEELVLYELRFRHTTQAL